MQVDLSKYNNSWYSPGKGVLVCVLWYIMNEFFFKTGFPISTSMKVFILRMYGAKIGKNLCIKPCVNIKYPWNLEIGDNTWIGENVWIDNLEKVKIGNNVCISQGALLLCGNHNYKKVSFDLLVGKIVLEDGVWIGAQSVVTGGVVVGSHAVLTVKSVASQNLDSYSIYQGNPVKKIRERIIVD